MYFMPPILAQGRIRDIRVRCYRYGTHTTKMGGMKYIGTYLLAAMSGDASEKKMKEILEAAGMEVDATLLKLVLKKLEGKEIHEIIAEGVSNLEACGGGGGAAGPAAGGASG